jgi:hypothetical protein
MDKTSSLFVAKQDRPLLKRTNATMRLYVISPRVETKENEHNKAFILRLPREKTRSRPYSGLLLMKDNKTDPSRQ